MGSLSKLLLGTEYQQNPSPFVCDSPDVHTEQDSLHKFEEPMLYLWKYFHRDHFCPFTQKRLLPPFTSAGWQIQAETHLSAAKPDSCISFQNKSGILSTSILLFQVREGFDYNKKKRNQKMPPQPHPQKNPKKTIKQPKQKKQIL